MFLKKNNMCQHNPLPRGPGPIGPSFSNGHLLKKSLFVIWPAIVYNKRNLKIWPSVAVICFQKQNQCHIIIINLSNHPIIAYYYVSKVL
jgi:hypothetical protein